eukprot:scaffold8005_cov391-Pinguiococcus_pyrenoidosus.AAC.3
MPRLPSPIRRLLRSRKPRLRPSGRFRRRWRRKGPECPCSNWILARPSSLRRSLSRRRSRRRSRSSSRSRSGTRTTRSRRSCTSFRVKVEMQVTSIRPSIHGTSIRQARCDHPSQQPRCG